LISGESTGTLASTIVVTELDGTATTHFAPPATGSGNAEVAVSYFLNGSFLTDRVQIHYTGTTDVGTGPIRSRLDGTTISPAGAAAQQSISAILADAAQNATPIDSTAIQFHLATWFDSFRPILQTGAQIDDDALRRGLRDFVEWQANADLLRMDPEGIAGDEFEAAVGDSITGLQAAIARANARGATATDLAPLVDVLRWSVTAEALGIATDANRLTLAAVAEDLYARVVITQASLTGPIGRAELTIRTELQIGGERVPFQVPIEIRVEPHGSSTVGTRQATLVGEGTWTTAAAIGEGDRELGITVRAGIRGLNLSAAEVVLAPSTIELRAAIASRTMTRFSPAFWTCRPASKRLSKLPRGPANKYCPGGSFSSR
jgi:hypothetical protein